MEKERMEDRIRRAAEEYITQTLPREIPENQKQFLIALCGHLGLDPFKGEIHFIAYRAREGYVVRPVVSYLVYIRRAIATGKLAGWSCEVVQEGGKTKAVTTIYRRDFQYPFVWETYLDEVRRDTQVWKEQPLFMLKKVCIAQAFRLAFPEDVGELPYAEEEVLGLDAGEEVTELKPAEAAGELPGELLGDEAAKFETAKTAKKVEVKVVQEKQETTEEKASNKTGAEKHKPSQEVKGLF